MLTGSATPPQVTLRYDDLEALERDFESNLRHGRAFALEAENVVEREMCELVIVHPNGGESCQREHPPEGASLFGRAAAQGGARGRSERAHRARALLRQGGVGAAAPEPPRHDSRGVAHGTQGQHPKVPARDDRRQHRLALVGRAASRAAHESAPRARIDRQGPAPLPKAELTLVSNQTVYPMPVRALAKKLQGR